MQITSLTFSQDGNTLLSRGMDETLKIWDLRK
jgi:WD40 repeat protein